MSGNSSTEAVTESKVMALIAQHLDPFCTVPDCDNCALVESLRELLQRRSSGEPAADWQHRVATGAITLRETARMLETQRVTRAACVSAMLRIANSLSLTKTPEQAFKVGDPVTTTWPSSRKDVGTIKELPHPGGQLYVIAWPDGGRLCVAAEDLRRASLNGAAK